MVPEGWNLKSLDSTAKIIDCKHRTPSYVQEGIPVVSPGSIKWGEIDIESPKKRVSQAEYESLMDHCVVESGDLVLSRNQSVGVASYVGNPVPFVLGQDTVLVKPAHVNAKFLYYSLQSRQTQRKILKIAGGSTFSRINLRDIRNLTILIPSQLEQVRIAQILSVWDRAILITEQLYNNSQQKKKALMHHLLTGKKRFPGFGSGKEFQKTRYGLVPTDWGFVMIGEVARQTTKKNTGGRDLPVLSCSKHEGFVDSLKYFKKKVYSDDTSNYNVVERGCFGFPSNHIEEGSIGYQDCYDAGIVSPIYTVFKTNARIDDGYLYRLLKTEHYRQIFAAATNASVDRRGSLRWKEFSKIRVPLPRMAEQQKISSVLKVNDREIEVLQQKLDYLKQEKKALMQQLLTGKRRVKID